MANDSRDTAAQEVIQQRDDSRSWLSNNFYDEFEEVWKHYHCRVDPYKDIEGNEDPDATNIGQPDTFSAVNRRVARVTAQIPNIGFTSYSGDSDLEDRVSRKIMWDWDEGRIQRCQKKHVRQGELFGWSPRAWWWERKEYMRRKGINLAKEQLTPEEIELITTTYELHEQAAMYLQAPVEEPARMAVIASLMKKAGRRGLLDVAYLYQAYEGPRSEVLFIGDCFPEPFFDDLQTSNWFIVELRRNKQWLTDLKKEWPEELGEGVDTLLEKHPKGTPPYVRSGSKENLRERLRRAAGQDDEITSNYNQAGRASSMWNITARWTPGQESEVTYVAEDSILLGTIKNPYDLEGKIPFTDLILCDSILGGIGDSASRVGRGLQTMRNMQSNRRFDLFRQFSQPMLGTNDQTIFDNPEMLTRQAFRVVMMRRGPQSIWHLNDQPSMASAAATMNEESGTLRSLQMLYGETNMSMAANIDPAQMRTATGAKIMQMNTDIITKDLVDSFHLTSVNPDVEMMYLLNRSEMSDGVRIDATKYRRNYDRDMSEERQAWITAEATDFQEDGRITVELGSTLADDDESKVAKATNQYQMLQGNPHVNQEQLAKDILIAHGKGSKLNLYIVPPQQPPGPEPPKVSISYSFKDENLTEAQKMAIMTEGGLAPEELTAAQQAVDQQVAQIQQLMQPPMEQPMPPMPEQPLQ